MGPACCVGRAHLGVHLRDDQGHALSHAEGRAVVHNLRPAASVRAASRLPLERATPPHDSAKTLLQLESVLNACAWAFCLGKGTDPDAYMRQTQGWCPPTLQANASRYWYVLLHPTATPTHNGTGLGGHGAQLLADGATGAEQRNVHIVEAAGRGYPVRASAPPWRQDAVTEGDAAPRDPIGM